MKKYFKNPTRIGVDGNEANIANRVGVNTYAFETLKAISEAVKKMYWVRFEVILKEEPLAHMPEENENFRYFVLPGEGMWIIKTLTPYLLKNSRKYDVFWSPSHYVPPVSFVPRVCSVMDLGYLTSKSQFRSYDYWQLKLWTALSLRLSKRIFAISDATKKDIESHYPFTKGKITTTLLGYDHRRYNQSVSKDKITEVKKKYNIEGEYVLFLSTLKPSKNIEGLLRAWKLLYEKYPKAKLVIAGKKGWLFESVFKVVAELRLENEVVFTDFFEEDEKPALVAGAKLFVLSSFWEGFGLDVLSAMACGVPVVVSDRGSLPEVVGEAGVIVNPDSAHDISRGLDKVLSADKKEYEGFVERGLLQAKKFGWKKTAQETIETLISVI